MWTAGFFFRHNISDICPNLLKKNFGHFEFHSAHLILRFLPNFAEIYRLTLVCSISGKFAAFPLDRDSTNNIASSFKGAIKSESLFIL